MIEILNPSYSRFLDRNPKKISKPGLATLKQ